MPYLKISTAVDTTVASAAVLAPYSCFAEIINYRIEDTSVATVDENGNVTAICTGETRLWAETASGLSIQCPVYVYARDDA